MERILAATDGSEHAARAADIAAQIALTAHCRLTLVHVVPVWRTPLEATVMPEYGPMVQAEWQRAGQALLEAEAQRLRRHEGLHVNTLLLEGHAASALVDAADKIQADLVVIGRQGLGALSRLLLGSASSKLVQLSSRPVLVVP